MTTTVTGNIEIKSGWDSQKSNGLTGLTGSPTREATVYKYSKTFTNGNDSTEIEEIFRDTRVVTSATQTDDIDLAGVLTNMFGDLIGFLKVRELTIVNKSSTAGQNLLVGGAASNPITSIHGGSGTAQYGVLAGGADVKVAPLDGFTVTAGSADTLRVEHDGAAGDIEYDIIIKGTITA